MNEISALELKEKMTHTDASFLVIDVREQMEFHTYNIGGLHIPLGKLQEALEDLPEDIDLEIIVICQKGIRSKTAQTILMNAGYKNVKNLKGGLSTFARI